ncbi:4-carboxymuconolactone decarboxylase [Nakamurella sp. UYEF19]|uniref:hypothetical protein n=1 Tax=Nakamurella sp. UYEF19 TaxID=1756392 RepID=UPI0033994505
MSTSQRRRQANEQRASGQLACDAATAHPGLLVSALDNGSLDVGGAGEVLVQAVPYVGMGRADAFARLTSEILAARGPQLPFVSRATATTSTAGDAGLHIQRRIVGAETVEFGGCDPQVAAHVIGNLNVGNDRALMTDAITAVLPWIGYRRTLNALRAIDQGTTGPAEL